MSKTGNYKYNKEYDSLSLESQEKVLMLIEKYRNAAEITLSDIVKEINALTGFNWTNRNLGDLTRDMNIPPKPKKLAYKTRNKTFKNTLKSRIEDEVKEYIERLEQMGVSQEDFSKLYYNKTLVEIENQYGLSAYQTKKVANYLNLKEIKRQYTYKDLWEDLQAAGVTREDLNDIYTTQNYPFADTQAWIETKIGKEIGYKSVVSLLKSLKIEKTKEQIKALQGRKSRKEKEENIEYFENLVGCSIEELAKIYEENRSMTKQSLLAEINSKVPKGGQLITEKWLGKAIDKHLSIPRLGIVSRLEIELAEYIKGIVGEDTLIITSDRKTIAPKELDIVIPKFNTAIEFNGEYWHSDDMLWKSSLMSAIDYHTEKKNLCKDNGLELLFVWEDDWNNNKEEVKNALVNYFNSKEVAPILSKLVNN